MCVPHRTYCIAMSLSGWRACHAIAFMVFLTWYYPCSCLPLLSPERRLSEGVDEAAATGMPDYQGASIGRYNIHKLMNDRLLATDAWLLSSCVAQLQHWPSLQLALMRTHMAHCLCGWAIRIHVETAPTTTRPGQASHAMLPPAT